MSCLPTVPFVFNRFSHSLVLNGLGLSLERECCSSESNDGLSKGLQLGGEDKR